MFPGLQADWKAAVVSLQVRVLISLRTQSSLNYCIVSFSVCSLHGSLEESTSGHGTSSLMAPLLWLTGSGQEKEDLNWYCSTPGIKPTLTHHLLN